MRRRVGMRDGYVVYGGAYRSTPRPYRPRGRLRPPRVRSPFDDRAHREAGAPLVICDLTQSYAPRGGGGISTYLREKRDYILGHTPHHLLQIVPGAEDKVTVDGRHIFAEVGAGRVRGSPDYRFILRTRVEIGRAHV